MRCPTEASSVDSTDSDWDCTSTVPTTGVNCPDTGSLEVDLPHRSPLLPLPDEWGLVAGTIHPEVPPLATLHHRVLHGNQCMKGLSEQRRDGHFIERNETILSITLYYERRPTFCLSKRNDSCLKINLIIVTRPLRSIKLSHLCWLFVFSAAVPEEATETVVLSARQVEVTVVFNYSW